MSNFTVGIKTKNPNIIFENDKIKLKKIKTDFSIRSFFKKEFAIKNAKIITKENSLKNIINMGLGGELNREDNVTEKLDGQNLMISWRA